MFWKTMVILIHYLGNMNSNSIFCEHVLNQDGRPTDTSKNWISSSGVQVQVSTVEPVATPTNDIAVYCPRPTVQLYITAATWDVAPTEVSETRFSAGEIEHWLMFWLATYVLYLWAKVQCKTGNKY